MTRFLIVAGDPSGERYGARLMRETKALDPGASFAGIGGDRMQAEGLNILYHCREMAAIGIVEMLSKARFFSRALSSVKEKIRNGLFDAAILIDYQGFNLRIAQTAKECGLPVFYYVLPQIWAWRRYRMRAMKELVDTRLSIFPFEPEFYKSYGSTAEFVGHPMLDEISEIADKPALREKFLEPGCDTLIGLLPGSRRGEVGHMLVPLLKTADVIREKFPRASFVLAAAPGIDTSVFKTALKGRRHIHVHSGSSHDIFASADLVITKSGTSTLEAAIFGVPAVIVYRGSAVSYHLANTLVMVEYAGLPNIIAGREIAKEFLQGEFVPEKVAEHALSLLTSPGLLAEAKRDMDAVREKLGGKGAAKRAATIIISKLRDLKAATWGPSRIL